MKEKVIRLIIPSRGNRASVINTKHQYPTVQSHISKANDRNI